MKLRKFWLKRERRRKKKLDKCCYNLDVKREKRIKKGCWDGDDLDKKAIEWRKFLVSL